MTTEHDNMGATVFDEADEVKQPFVRSNHTSIERADNGFIFTWHEMSPSTGSPFAPQTLHQQTASHREVFASLEDLFARLADFFGSKA